MIKINIKENEILLEGHALYDINGKDIVCASVSSITITTVNALLRYDKSCISYQEKDGFLKITINKKDNFINMLIENMIDLFRSLEKQYEENIKVNEEV